ncbi:MAG: hypothetical protein QXI37_03350, partial [Thermoprotei archaeon]
MNDHVSADRHDPMGVVKSELLKRVDATLGIEPKRFEIPPESSMGDLALPLHVTAKQLGLNPRDLASKVASQISGSSDYVEKVEELNGYVNVFIKTESLAAL